MAEIRDKCNATVDNEFGPAVACNEFDFTLAFEQTILLIGTSGIFILASLRLTTLYKESIKVNGLYYLRGMQDGMRTHGALMLLTCLRSLSIAILAVKAINLVLWVRSPVTRYSVAAASVTFAGTLGLIVLVFLEHSRSKRPSSIISIHLLAQIVAESCILRTLELRSYTPALVRTTWASVLLQLAMLALESTSKEVLLEKPWRIWRRGNGGHIRPKSSCGG